MTAMQLLYSSKGSGGTKSQAKAVRQFVAELAMCHQIAVCLDDSKILCCSHCQAIAYDHPGRYC